MIIHDYVRMTSIEIGPLDPNWIDDSFASAICAFLRAEEFVEAEKFLEPYARSLESEIGEICLNLSSESVEILGWEKVWAGIERCGSDREITAIGVDLSPHPETTLITDGEREPGIETNYYADDAFPFSKSSRAELLSECQGYSTPWQGCFTDIDWALSVKGLARLYSAIQAQNDKADSSEPAARIGMAYLLLRFHESTKRDAERAGLQRPLPIIVSEHAFGGPSFASVYCVDRTVENQSTVDQILSKEATDRLKEHRAYMEELIQIFSENREKVLRWNPKSNPKQHQTFVDACRSIESLENKVSGINESRASWEMSDTEFVDYLQAVWSGNGMDGHPPSTRTQGSSTPQAPKSKISRVLGFGRRKG